ncbi:hypothetical protein DH2020_014910 [Rehmannia glutinosa]|uniref:GIR1-like zinc ribbon domain-containing protein n=1 Tax=Rehmannia glutinosa TaxID=99300 RepID=A0ABR0X1G8_REHGL
MSHRNVNGPPKLDLKLNLSPPRAIHPRSESPSRSLTVSPTSPPSSCVSSELNQQDECLKYSTSPEATSMMLVGCPRCLMYVMLAEEDPRCSFPSDGLLVRKTETDACTKLFRPTNILKLIHL